jgi:arylsulfatase A-like enzyme
MSLEQASPLARVRAGDCVLVACFLAFGTACSQSEAAWRGNSVRPRLLWDDPAAPGNVQSLMTFDLPPSAANWGNVHPSPRSLERGSDWRVDVWNGGGVLTLDLPSDLQDFDGVTVRGRFQGGHRIELRLLAGQHSQSWSRNLSMPSDEESQAVLLALDDRDFDAPRPASAVLIVKGPKCTIEAIEFSRRPLQDLLPEPEEGRPVSLGGQVRMAAGITAGRALACSFESASDETLEFSYGRWPAAGSDTPGVRLHVVLEAAAGEVRSSFELDGSAGWLSARVALDGAARGPQRARFELEAPAGVEAACALAEVWVGRRSPSAPTVLLITSDTHRGDFLGAANSGVEVLTPALDRLARRGVLFEDCYGAINSTVASHVSIFTGLSPRQTGLLSNFERLDEQAHTLGDVFREQGFRTFGVISAGHLGPQQGNVGQGFDRLAGGDAGEGTADQAVAHLLEWIEHAEGQPLFAWVHVFDAHFPFEPPDEFAALYYPEEAAIEASSESEPERAIHAAYRAEISFLDAQLGALLEHPRLGAGVVAFTADHGEILHLPGARYYHALPVPSTLHVPMILTWPGAPAGRRVSTPVELVDVGRTLLDLSGLAGQDFPGRNLLDSAGARGQSDAPRFALGDKATHAALTVGNDFLILQLDDQGHPGIDLGLHQSALFDRVLDRPCLNDLSARRPARVRELRKLLIEWLNLPGAGGLGRVADLSTERLEALHALGYSDGAAPPPGAWIDPDCACAVCRAWRD